MLNSSVRREAIETLKKAINRHESIRKNVEHASVQLFKQRQRATGEVIERVEEYINLLANSPKEFDKSYAEYRIEAGRFDSTVQRLETEAARSTRIGSTTGTAGAVAGVGVAALGPAAAMAVATTFGTASTGAAISALSGAAATNAALAWLGGGAIAAGGGGMAAGNTLLILAGPVGWTIGGLAIAGSATYRIAHHCSGRRDRWIILYGWPIPNSNSYIGHLGRQSRGEACRLSHQGWTRRSRIGTDCTAQSLRKKGARTA